MRKILGFLVSLLLLFFVFGCKKNSTTEQPVIGPDITIPTISLVDPTAGKNYILGAALHLQVDLSDNVELKSYKITIAKSAKGLQTSDWAYDVTTVIPSGKKTLAVNNSDITVPLTVTGNQTTTGNYDFTVTCWDTSSNQTSFSLVISLSKN